MTYIIVLASITIGMLIGNYFTVVSMIKNVSKVTGLELHKRALEFAITTYYLRYFKKFIIEE